MQRYGLGACQVPLSMGFSRQEYWSGLPSPPLGDLPKPGVESLMSPALVAGFFTTHATWAALLVEGRSEDASGSPASTSPQASAFTYLVSHDYVNHFNGKQSLC